MSSLPQSTNVRRLLPSSCWLTLAFTWAVMGASPLLAAEIPVGTPPEPEEAAPAVDPASLPQEIILRDYLVIPQVGVYGRTPLHVDRLESRLVRGDWKYPEAGNTITSPTGTIVKWEPALAEEDGTLSHSALRGGYAVTRIESPVERLMLLEPKGHGTCWVNGIPRAGDPYLTGRLILPVQLQKGENVFLFHVGSGEMTARLVVPKQGDFIDLRDNTLPDLIAGETGEWLGAVLVVNSALEVLKDVCLEARLPDQPPQRVELNSIIPLTTRKLPFRIVGKVPTDLEKVEVELKLLQGRGEGAKQLDAVKVAVAIKQGDQLHQRTFVSEIDGSVQPYAIRPAGKRDSVEPPAMILALHGAAVEPLAEAELYPQLNWAHVVAPMNRRSYGFDWEDWGRIDAHEALAAANAVYPADQRRLILAGQSMGGHGCWHLGVTAPDRFAALAPSGGWISFWTYGGVTQTEFPSEMQTLLSRAPSESDTLKLVRNLEPMAIYLRHADNDEVVPVKQGQIMRGELAQFHTNFAYQQPAGTEASINEAAPEVMEYLRQQKLRPAEEVQQLTFTTANPGISSRMHWITVEAQQVQFEPSEVTIHFEANNRHFLGTTKNVARISLDVTHLEPKKGVTVTLDGQKFGPLPWPAGTPRLWFSRNKERWQVSTQAPHSQKGPHRYGLFKDAIRNKVLFIYGTRGNPEENAWSLAKARYDAETFAYRGNSSVEIIADTEFDASHEPDRNVILYGNVATNGAWPALLSLCPIQVRRGQLSIGTRPEVGDDLACVFIRPRPGSSTASVGVVSGTGLTGFRATNRLRYFVSGIAYPDVLIYGAEALQQGADEVRLLGYFGLNWSLDEGELAWRDLAL